MSFGFPAYSNGSQTFQVSQHQLIEITAKALKQLGWRHSNPFPNSFLVHNDRFHDRFDRGAGRFLKERDDTRRLASISRG